MRIFRHYSFKFRAIYTYLNADISNLLACYGENLLEKLVSFSYCPMTMSIGWIKGLQILIENTKYFKR